MLQGEIDMPQGTTLDVRLQIYRKVLVEEFLREFKFLIDVVAGRAKARGDFTDKLVEAMKLGAAALFKNAPAIPVIGFAKEIVHTLIDKGLDVLNDQRKETKRYAAIKEAQFEIDFEALRIVLNVVALHASRRFEFVIANKLSEIPTDAVIPFAKTGVERMLEYVARHRLPLQPEHLLTGLLYGRSGAYVSGYFNTRLAGKNPQMMFTAEGIYARSAFMTPEGKFWVARKASTLEFKAKSFLQNVTDLVPDNVKGFMKTKNPTAPTSPTGITPLTVKFDKANPLDPKYGYALMSQKGVDAYYGQTKEEQSIAKVSSALQQVVKSHTAHYQIIDRQDIEGYLKSDKKKTFIDYLKTKYPKIKAAAYEPANESDLDLSALSFKDANFNDCVLNGIKVGGDISNSRFQNAFLFGADFSKVTQAKEASFQNSHLEFLKAVSANLSHADFTGAQCQFADLTGANLSYIKHLGAQWLEAKLINLQTENKQLDNQTQTDLVNEQQKQAQAIKLQQQELQALEKELQHQKQEVIELRTLIQRLEGQLEKRALEKDPEQARILEAQTKTLQKMLADLSQERQTRETFTRFCQNQLESLQKKAETHDKCLNLHDEQIKQLRAQLQGDRGKEPPIKSLMADISASLSRLENVEVRQNQNNTQVKQLETRVNDYVKSQQIAMETVFEGLNNIQEEVAQFKKEVRHDIDAIDKRVAALEAVFNIKPISVEERGNIFTQKFTSMLAQLTGLQVAQPALNPLIDPDYAIASTQLSFQQKLAEDSFGKVYLGRWCEQDVAIKMVEGRLNEADKREFIREVNIMSRLRNPNIVQFYGACLESNRACLVMELMEQGSLTQLMAKGPLTPLQQKQVALDITRGLYFLHSQKVLHRDMKTGNILINKEGRAKISDFGLSKVNYTGIQSIHKQADAIQYQSPESLQGKDYTEKSDIYSLGVVLWEIFTGKKLCVNIKGIALTQAIINGQREEIPREVPQIIKRLIEDCWQTDPDKRPVLTHILREIEHYQPRSVSPVPEVYYTQGLEAEKQHNLVEAKRCYQKAVDKDHVRAKTNLGTFFLKGLGGCPIDKKLAFRYFEDAAKAGHIRAMFNAATMLENGDGVPMDLRQALAWLEQAAAKGDKDATAKVTELKALIQYSGIAEEKNKNNLSMNSN